MMTPTSQTARKTRIPASGTSFRPMAARRPLRSRAGVLPAAMLDIGALLALCGDAQRRDGPLVRCDAEPRPPGQLHDVAHRAEGRVGGAAPGEILRAVQRRRMLEPRRGEEMDRRRER